MPETGLPEKKKAGFMEEGRLPDLDLHFFQSSLFFKNIRSTLSNHQHPSWRDAVK
jgi:hypothetical protein